LKNSQILDLIEGISRINEMTIEEDISKKFNYALIMNDNNNRSTAKAIIEVSTPSDKYAEYENERESIVLEYCIKDDDGKPVLTDGRWIKVIPDKKEELDTKIEELNTQYQDVLDQRNKDLEDFNTILDTEVDVDIVTVSIDDVPDVVGRDRVLMKLIINMIE